MSFFFVVVALGLCWCLRAFSSCRELGLLCLAAHGLPVAGFPGGSDGKESACNTGDLGSIRELGRSPGEGNGNPLQYSSLENSMDRGAWGLQSMESKEADMTEHTAHLFFVFISIAFGNSPKKILL